MIKNFLIAAVIGLASATLPAAAQPAAETVSASSETFYISLVSRSKMTDRTDSGATIDIGQQLRVLTGMSDGFAAQVRKRRFPSLLDGLNTLAVNGWELAAINAVAQPGGVTVTTWILKKSVSNRDELLDGLLP